MIGIEEYSGELERDFGKYLKRCVKHADDEDFHQLRVTVKKIRALLQLLSYCHGQTKQGGKKLENLFKRAGKIRDLQLLIHRLRKQIKSGDKGGRELQHRLQERLDLRIERFQHRYRHREKETLAKTLLTIERMIRAERVATTADYFRTTKEKIIATLREPVLDEKQLHHLRAGIKSLHYNHRLAPRVGAARLIDDTQLIKWEKLLGEWHDAVGIARKMDKLQTTATLELQQRLRGIEKTHNDLAEDLLKQFWKRTIS
jgi:CHAD domain-containing protein